MINYDMDYKLPAQDALYVPDAYRSSDHDATIVGLDMETWYICMPLMVRSATP